MVSQVVCVSTFFRIWPTKTVTFLYEVYTDEEAFKEHLATSHAQSAMACSQDWAEKGLEVTRATSVYPTEQRYFATPSSDE
jgi:quinol monooxygenase YgiN